MGNTRTKSAKINTQTARCNVYTRNPQSQNSNKAAKIQNQWSCPKCTFLNPLVVSKCSICNHQKQLQKTTKCSEWHCTVCTFKNEGLLSQTQCSMCRNPNASRNESNQWTCPSCTVLNDSTNGYCSLCNNPNPAHAKNTDFFHEQYVSDSKCCYGTISKCGALNYLSLVMRDHINGSTNLYTIDIGRVVGYFHHLTSEHDDDAEFESIYKTITPDGHTTKCDVFTRTHRNRNTKRSLHEQNTLHFSHCYDIGHRLTVKEKESMNSTNDLLKLLSNRHKIHKNRTSKFMSMVDDDEKLTGHSVAGHCDYKDMKMYDFGVEFKYKSIQNKYDSFKEELTENKTCTISTGQFHCELEKAKLHFQSVYCQNDLMKTQHEEDRIKVMKWDYIAITVEHILAVLIYCNFDVLSNEFSATYRAMHKYESKQSIVRRHLEFYFLGKYLKETVHRLGTNVDEGNIKRFYHGISERLLFPLRDLSEQRLHIPLSTSSDSAVAFSFTAERGLLVEFVNDNHTLNYHFSANWCSDYGNEKEHLFIQNARGCLKFDNIIDGTDAFKYTLGGINLLKDVFYCNEEYTKIKARFAVRLVRHQTGMEEWPDLHFYAKALFREYCSNIQRVNITWSQMKWRYPLIHQLLSSETYDGINIGLLNALYPNLNSILIFEMPICESLFGDILTHFMSMIETNTPCKIDGVEFQTIQSKVQDSVINEYDNIFKDIGFSVKQHTSGGSAARTISIQVIERSRIKGAAFKSSLSKSTEIWRECTNYY
eukprot:401727_1